MWLSKLWQTVQEILGVVIAADYVATSFADCSLDPSVKLWFNVIATHKEQWFDFHVLAH